MLKRMVDEGIQAVRIAEEADETHPIIKMLSKDTTDSYESALKDFYRKDPSRGASDPVECPLGHHASFLRPETIQFRKSRPL